MFADGEALPLPPRTQELEEGAQGGVEGREQELHLEREG